MTEQEYIKKTNPIVRFLTHVFDESVEIQANVFVAQAAQNTKALITTLDSVKQQIEKWQEELKTMED